jgi:hypothetical protein
MMAVMNRSGVTCHGRAASTAPALVTAGVVMTAQPDGGDHRSEEEHGRTHGQ